MNNQDMPIIKLELTHLKHNVMAHIVSHSDEVNKFIESSLDEILTSEHLKDHIHEQTRFAVKEAVTNSINNYFKYGDGKKIIADSVMAMFNQRNEG